MLIFGISYQHKVNANRINDPELSDLSDRIIAGINKSFRKLVETEAARHGSLIISDDKGHPQFVPAKELLKKLQK
jgi:hypothetical protein